jgi:hypothetical protein
MTVIEVCGSPRVQNCRANKPLMLLMASLYFHLWDMTSFMSLMASLSFHLWDRTSLTSCMSLMVLMASWQKMTDFPSIMMSLMASLLN